MAKTQPKPDLEVITLTFTLSAPDGTKHRVTRDDLRDHMMSELADTEYWPSEADGAEAYLTDSVVFPDLVGHLLPKSAQEPNEGASLLVSGSVYRFDRSIGGYSNGEFAYSWADLHEQGPIYFLEFGS